MVRSDVANCAIAEPQASALFVQRVLVGHLVHAVADFRDDIVVVGSVDDL